MNLSNTFLLVIVIFVVNLSVTMYHVLNVVAMRAMPYTMMTGFIIGAEMFPLLIFIDAIIIGIWKA